MSITVTCDECSESHRVKDDAVGKRFQCNGCGKSLKVEAAPPPYIEFDDIEQASVNDEFDESADADAASKRAKSASRSSSKIKSGKLKSVPLRKTKVPLGIDLVFLGFLLSMFVIIGLFAIGWSFRGNVRAIRPIVYGSLFLGIAGILLTTAGKLLCLTAPPQMSGKGSILVAVLIDVLALLITVAKLFTILPPWLTGMVNLLSVGGFVCFIWFLRHLGEFIGERHISVRASNVLTLGIGVVVLWLLMLGMGVLALAGGLPPFFAGIGMMLLVVVLLIVGAIGAIRYGGLLLASRYALSNC